MRLKLLTLALSWPQSCPAMARICWMHTVMRVPTTLCWRRPMPPGFPPVKVWMQARALLLPQINGRVDLAARPRVTAARSSRTLTIPARPSAAAGSAIPVRATSTARSLRACSTSASTPTCKAAHSTADAQDQTYQAAVQDLFVRVATAYFTVLTDEDELTFAKANEEAFKRHYDQAAQQYKVGIAAVTDVYQAKAVLRGRQSDDDQR